MPAALIPYFFLFSPIFRKSSNSRLFPTFSQFLDRKPPKTSCFPPNSSHFYRKYSSSPRKPLFFYYPPPDSLFPLISHKRFKQLPYISLLLVVCIRYLHTLRKTQLLSFLFLFGLISTSYITLLYYNSHICTFNICNLQYFKGLLCTLISKIIFIEIP